MFDYLLRQGVITSSQDPDGEQKQKQQQQVMHPCLIDAEDLLRQPERVVKAYCRCIGLDYRPTMLQWDSREDDDHAAQVFATWTGFHRDAIESRGLKARKDRVSSLFSSRGTLIGTNCTNNGCSPADPRRRISTRGWRSLGNTELP
jgi:hypothetical protein